MRSLRSQLLVTLGGATLVLFLAAGLLLDALLRGALWAEFDAALLAQARIFASIVEQDEEGIEFEGAEAGATLTAMMDGIAIWDDHGRALARFGAMRDAARAPLDGATEAPTFLTDDSPRGSAARLVGFRFRARRDEAVNLPGEAPLCAITVARSTEALLATIRRVRGILFGVAVGGALLTAAVAALCIPRVLRPLNQLAGQIARLDATDRRARVAVDGLQSELQPIVERLNESLGRLSGAFERERRFTGDVAQELRTPLAGLRSTLELALSRDRTPGEYRAAMQGGLSVSLAMQRMVEQLLHLARADARQLPVRAVMLDAAALLRECWAPAMEPARRRGANMVLRAPETCELRSDADLLRSVISNLLANAAAYVDDGGQISADLSGSDGRVVLELRNSGCALSNADISRVFDRFWRADAARSANGEPHWGLGLPLCQALLTQIGGTITVRVDALGIFTATVLIDALPPSDAPR